LSLGSAQDIGVQNGLGSPVKITAAEIAALSLQEIVLDDRGKTVRFGGVPLRLVLETATGLSLSAAVKTFPCFW
jgi:hypothetical protein